LECAPESQHSILVWPIMGALKQTTINAGLSSHPDARLTAVEAERWVSNGSPKPPMPVGGVRNEPEAAIVNKYDVELGAAGGQGCIIPLFFMRQFQVASWTLGRCLGGCVVFSLSAVDPERAGEACADQALLVPWLLTIRPLSCLCEQSQT